MSKPKPRPSPRDLLLQLCQAKQAALESRRKRSDHAAQVGACEYVDTELVAEDFSVQGLRCFQSDRAKPDWCDVCKAKEPFFEDFKKKTHAFQAAVRVVLREGKKIANEHH